MDLYQLKTFHVVSRLGSYTEAAKSLFVTQSAVSHSIKKLENSLDIRLIKRKGKDFELTEAGKALRDSCEKIFQEIEKTQENILHFHKRAEWGLRIGATVEFGTTILMKHIRGFTDRHRSIHLDFLFSHNLLEPLLRDEVDFIIDCKEKPMHGLEKINLFREQYVVIASPDLLKNHRIQKIRDMQETRMLSLDKDLKWWENFLVCFKHDELPVFKNIMEINHIRGIINAALSGLGIGFVPKYTVLNELEKKTLIDPFPSIRPKADIFSIYIKHGKLKLEKNRVFIDYLKKIKVSEFGSE